MAHIDGELNICVISVWFGRLPSYLPCFLKTCAANSFVDWILVSDQQLSSMPPENIRVMAMSKTSFTELASKQLGFNININDPYKLCDFKPLFGKIFQDQLESYNYWGYCDLDIIFGTLSKQIQPLLIESPDIISFYQGFLSGPFCLFRNTSIVVNLFSQIPDYKSILQDPEHKAFDEHIPKRTPSFRILYYRMLYLLKLVFVGPRYSLHGREIRYQFQWYAKQLNSRISQPSDMTDMVHKASRAKHLNVIFKELIRSDRAFRRMGRNTWNLSWQKGILRDRNCGAELFAFHFVDSKNNSDFVVDLVDNNTEKFTISDQGIECSMHEKKEK
jgi:hypothetical protein